MRIRTRRSDEQRRRDMVERQIRQRGVKDETVLEAMLSVPRHAFVPDSHADLSYADCALPIGHGATISQPYIVAMMTEALEVAAGARVLEIGTGSGYQAAVLAACGARVFSVERVPALHLRAKRILGEAGFDRVRLKLGDGSRGWPEEAPFDRILVTAWAPEPPRVLLEQLSDGGVMVAPIGDEALQHVRRLRREGDRVVARDLEGVRFVPLIFGGE